MMKRPPYDAKTKAEIIDKLKKLDGLPPHGGFNMCAGDGYFANSIIRDYGMSLADLRKAVGYGKIEKKIRKLLKQAAEVK